MTIGVCIDHLSEEWIHLATRSHRPDSEYAVTASQLIHSFSDILCDYVLDQIDMRKVAAVVNLEAKFFGGNGTMGTTISPWIEYTASVVNMANFRGNYESEQFYQLCSECIRRAQILGNSLQMKRKY
jgi:hypothetical protein